MRAQRVLAVCAHPDDESVLAGGTLAACAEAGIDVKVLSLTAGEAGPIADPGVAARDQLGAVRAEELRAAAEALGAAAECLDLPDGELRWLAPETVESVLLDRLRRDVPDIVVTFGPEGWYWHHDHVTVHDRTVAALSRLAGEGFHPSLYYATWPEGHMAALATLLASRRILPELWGLQ